MNESDECWFNHERLEVYREAIAFIGWLSQLLDGMPRVADVKDQLDRVGLIKRQSARDYAKSASPSES